MSKTCFGVTISSIDGKKSIFWYCKGTNFNVLHTACCESEKNVIPIPVQRTTLKHAYIQSSLILIPSKWPGIYTTYLRRHSA